MYAPDWRWTLRNAALCAAVLLAASAAQAQKPHPVLTIQVGGDLLKHGGVVTVYPIPTPVEDWAKTGEGEVIAPVLIEGRYAIVQMRYPANGTYGFRFRPTSDLAQADKLATQPLTIIGTDERDRGPRMKAGFADAYSSGGQIIRVLSEKERSGPGEATRSIGRWGETLAHADPPPADERSTRALLAAVDHGPEPWPLTCTGDERAQVCTIAKEKWVALEARWWRSIAESRLERLNHHALRRCYDSTWSSGGTCEADPNSNEPAYNYRRK